MYTYKMRGSWGVASLLLPLLASGCGPSAVDSMDDVAEQAAALAATTEPSLAAARPQLSTISPASAANRGGTPLLLTGRNFAAGATVKIAGALATSSVLSSTTIAVTLPARPDRCGLVPVRVENPTGRGDARSDLFSYLGEFGYRDPVQYAVVPYANEVAIADFNLDGRLDLVVSTGADGSQVSLLYGAGDGTFAPARNLNAGGLPISVITADFNLDGKADLAVSDWTEAAKGHVLLGNGHSVPGTPFRTPIAFSTPEEIYRLKSGDLNGDGKVDLLSFGDSSVGVMLGKGDGSFAAPKELRRASRPWDVASGDLNGDGKEDLIIANLGDDNISVLQGKGDGTFLTGVNYASDTGPFFVSIADVNRDGKLDVVSGNARTLSVFLGKGDGTLAAAKNYTASAHGVNDMTVRDLDGDGRLDVAVIDMLGSSVNILRGNGDGSFAALQSFSSGVMPNWIGVGDFDGDLRPDLVATSLTEPGSVAVMTRACM